MTSTAEVTLETIRDSLLEDSYGSFKSHPIKLAHYAVTSLTNSSNVSHDILGTYLTAISATAMGKKLANFSLFKADIVLTVIVQGQAFAAGKMLVIAQPAPNNAGVATVTHIPPISLANIEVLPHVDIDPSTNQSYTLKLPCINPQGKYSTAGGSGSWWVDLLVINHLFSGTATAAAASICIYMHLENVVLDGLTLLSNDFVREKLPNSLSSITRTLGTAARFVGSSFPAISPYTTLFSKVADTAGDTLSFFGYAKSRSLENQAFLLNRPNDNWSHNTGRTTAMVLASSQTNSLGLHPGLGCGTGDDMTMKYIQNKYGYVGTYSVTPVDGSESIEFIFPVNPTWNGMTVANSVLWTPLAGTLAPFTYWCGDLTYKFEVRASVFHRCTLLIAWDPKGDGISIPSFVQALEVLNNTTMTVSGNSTFEFVVPYKQERPYKLVDTTTTSTSSTYGNGFVYVFLVNPLTSGGSTESINVNIYVKSDNMFMALPASNNIAQKLVNVVALSKDSVRVSFGKSTDTASCPFKSFGEEFHTVKDLSSKMSFYQRGSLAAIAGDLYAGSNIPVLPLCVTTNNPAVSGATVVYNTYASWIASAYLGYRGSMNFTHHCRGTTIGNHYWAGNGYLVANPNSYPYNYTTNSDTIVTLSQWNAFTTANRSMAPAIDIVASSFYPLDYTTPRCSMSTFPNSVVFAIGAPTTGNTVDMMTLASTGDDATFCGFLGFPATKT